MDYDAKTLAHAFREAKLATLATALPTGGAWSYELKHDGYRMLAAKAPDGVRLSSRTAHDWTAPFEVVATELARLKARACVVDGEVCAIDAAGKPSFQLLQNRPSGLRLVYFAFDLLYDGEDVRRLPLEERRARLAKMIKPLAKRGVVLFSASTDSDPAHLLASACAAGLEGIIAKRVGSLYTPGRSREWLKIKCTKRQEFAIIGWMPLDTAQTSVASLLLGLADAAGTFYYAGRVGTGFDDKTRKSLCTFLQKDATATPMARNVPRDAKGAHFVTPRYAAEVAYTERTNDGGLRHPSFQGLRRDKAAADCVLEEGEPPPAVSQNAHSRWRRRST